MDKLREHIDEIKSDLNSLILHLNGVDISSYNEKADYVRLMLSNIESKRISLRKTHNKGELEKYNEEFVSLIKQLSETFDNLIEENRKEQKVIGAELRKINNKKKLSNYR